MFENEDATANQDYIGWVWKGEYNRVLSDNCYAEIRAGRVGYTWTVGRLFRRDPARRHRQPAGHRRQHQVA